MTFNIIKKANCGKVSSPEKQTLTYNIGYDTDTKAFHFRVTDNNGGGFFSHEWIALSSITQAIKNRGTFNANIFTDLFESKSANNSGFLAAALKAEKLLLPHKDTKRLHKFGDVDAFTKSMQKLLKVSLPDEVAKREALKEAKRIELEKKLKAVKSKQPTKTPKTKT